MFVQKETMESLDCAQAIENKLADNFTNGLSEPSMWLRRESARQWLAEQSDLNLVSALLKLHVLMTWFLT